MEDAVSLARRAGQEYVPGADILVPGNADLERDLTSLARGLERPSSLYEVCDHVQAVVWNDPARTAFFLGRPLDAILFWMAGEGREAFAHEEPFAYAFLDSCLDHGARPSSLACAVLRPISDLFHNPSVPAWVLSPVCLVLHRLAEDADARTMMECPRLFDSLAKGMDRDSALSVLHLVLSVNVFSPSVVGPVVEWCARSLLRHDPSVRSAGILDFLAVCVAREPAWRERLVPHAVHLSRAMWPVECGFFLSEMLRGTSVQLVLALHAGGKLSSLVQIAKARSLLHSTWTLVRALLAHHWPEQCGGEEGKPPRSRVCCPITLSECVRPVVASDGHTYERDALLRHLASNGMVSPMTREELQYHLFVNRAVLV